MRLVGDEPGALDVLKNEIPKLVVGWAKTTSLDPAEKKGKLKEMFDDESGRADELATAFDLFAGRFEARVAELVRKELGDVTNRLEQILKTMSDGTPVESEPRRMRMKSMWDLCKQKCQRNWIPQRDWFTL